MEHAVGKAGHARNYASHTKENGAKLITIVIISVYGSSSEMKSKLGKKNPQPLVAFRW